MIYLASYAHPDADRVGRRYTMQIHARSLAEARRILRRRRLPQARLLVGLWPRASRVLRGRRTPLSKVHALLFLALLDCRDRAFAARWLDDEAGLFHVLLHKLQSREEGVRLPWVPTWAELERRVRAVERRVPGYLPRGRRG